MALTENQIYTGVLYRKCVYDFITSAPFIACFVELKKITKGVLIEKMGKGKHQRTFENFSNTFDYFDKLEESLEFDETNWINNVNVLEEFFKEVMENTCGSFQSINKQHQLFFKSLKRNGLFHGNIIVPPIKSSPAQYSSDQPSATESVPRMKYHSGATASTAFADKVHFKPLDADKCYHINLTGKRGICLLVNIFREYSAFDVPPAKKIFEDLNYEVRVFDNVTSYEYIDSLIKIREEIEQLKSDSFILIFSSHGDQNSVTFADGKKLNRADLIKEFAGDYCPTLINRPKLFIFQNCRGPETHFEDTSELEQFMEDADSTDVATPRHDSSKRSTTIPSDILRLYATTDGTVAYRDETGSIFLQALYNILRDPELRRLPISELEIELRRQVLAKSQTTLSADHKIGGQLPESTTSLTKTFYFCHPHT